MIELVASRPHYATHLAPLLAHLPARLVERPSDRAEVAIVASYADHLAARKARARRIVVMEHGVGQSYRTGHPSYPGGRDRGDAALFLTPNHYSATLWRAAYPRIPAVAIGSPRLDSLPPREPGPGPVVAIGWHWECGVSPWAGNAWRDFRSALPALAEAFTVIGHGHPRIIDSLGPHYRRRGIEVVRDFDEVCRRADIYVADNTSTLFEFASTGRPVVVMNARRWRGPGPGMRFWDAANIGAQVDDPATLVDAIHRTLEDRLPPIVDREAALDVVYACRPGAAARAADIIHASVSVAA